MSSFSDPFGLRPTVDTPPHKWDADDAQQVFSDLAQLAPQINHEVAWFLPKNLAYALLGIGASKVVQAATTADVVHYTSAEGAAAIEASGSLRAGSFVALPSETAGQSAAAVEQLLEIAPGKGAMRAVISVPVDALRIPFNGPVTSGGATQFQVVKDILIKAGTFTATP